LATTNAPNRSGRAGRTASNFYELPDNLDEAAEDFVARAGSDQIRPVIAEAASSSNSSQGRQGELNMRLPRSLLDAVKEAADRQGMPYQRFIRQPLGNAVRDPLGPG
jgi:predicted DNA binding CopG/RHH family protein